MRFSRSLSSLNILRRSIHFIMTWCNKPGLSNLVVLGMVAYISPGTLHIQIFNYLRTSLSPLCSYPVQDRLEILKRRVSATCGYALMNFISFNGGKAISKTFFINITSYFDRKCPVGYFKNTETFCFEGISANSCLTTGSLWIYRNP